MYDSALPRECPLWVKNGKARSEQDESAPLPKADALRRDLDVRKVPLADIRTTYSITSSALTRSDCGTFRFMPATTRSRRLIGHLFGAG